MKARSAIVYTVLRLLAFVVPFAILMLFPIFRELYWLAAIFAALIGLSLSMLFLRRPLAGMTAGIADRPARPRRTPRDEDVEDAAADAAAESRDAAPRTGAPSTASVVPAQDESGRDAAG